MEHVLRFKGLKSSSAYPRVRSGSFLVASVMIWSAIPFAKSQFLLNVAWQSVSFVWPEEIIGTQLRKWPVLASQQSALLSRKFVSL